MRPKFGGSEALKSEMPDVSNWCVRYFNQIILVIVIVIELYLLLFSIIFRVHNSSKKLEVSTSQMDVVIMIDKNDV